MTTRREFFTQKIRKREYQTVEIYHPTIGVLRYVSGRIDFKNFTLESTAPRNPGALVTFTAGSFSFKEPDQNSSFIETDLQLGRVGKQIKQKLKSITGANRFLTGEVIYRTYFDGEESAPAFVLRLYIASATMTSQGAVLRITQDNPNDRGIASLYTSERFPGLTESL
jgi:hypothetical protein